MPTQTLQFSRPLTPAFFEGASHDDLKWTINYLISLLEKPERKEEVIAPMSVNEAKKMLSKKKLKSRNIPGNFNGMRDEVNPKYL